MMIIAKLLNPKNDYVFKRIFGHVGNEDITKGLLNSILKTKVEELTFDCNPILEKELYEDKIGILDIRARLNDNTNCDIEIQVLDNNNIEKRILYYWSLMYSKSIKNGEEYEKLEKCIVVLFVDYKLKITNDIKKYFTIWNLREQDNTDCVLTTDLEIYIIELPKVSNTENQTNILNYWVNFINNPEVMNMENVENEEIKKAMEILEDISKDEKERYLAELRIKYIRDQNSFRKTGYEQGKEYGREQTLKNVVKKMLENNIDIEMIIQCTGLTKEEIEKIK